MATYEIDFAALQNAIARQEDIISRMEAEIKKMENIKETMLNDSLWKGPNKSRYFQSFAEYQNALNTLYMSAVEHLNKLIEMKQTYMTAEM